MFGEEGCRRDAAELRMPVPVVLQKNEFEVEFEIRSARMVAERCKMIDLDGLDVKEALQTLSSDDQISNAELALGSTKIGPDGSISRKSAHISVLLY